MSDNAMGSTIERTWARVLELDHVAPDADFFSLGGDSFTAMRLLAAVEEATGTPLTFRDLLDAPVLRDFVERVGAAGARGTARSARRRNRSVAPLTRVQLQQWRTRKLSSNAAEVYWLYEVDGPLDIEVLRRAFDELVARHEILRTTVRRRFGRVRQVVHASMPGLLRVVDADELPKRMRTPAGAAQWAFEENFGAFDYQQGPLVRTTLVVLGSRRYMLSVAANEMAVDGSSRRVFANALSTLYTLMLETGSAEAYPPPPLQFGDFAVRVRSLTPRKQFLAQLAYWRAKFAEVAPGVAVRGATLSATPDWTGPIPDRSLELLPGFVADVRKAARAMSVSAFNVLAAGFAVLLHAMADTDAPAFTTTVSHRDIHGAEHLIGTFFNIVLVAVPLDGVTTAEDLVRQTSAATREAFVHREVPFGHAMRFRRGSPADGMLDVTRLRFQLHEDPGEIRLPGVRMRRLPPPFKPTHQLYLAATWTPEGGLGLYFSCRPDMPQQVVHNFLATYRRVLDTIARDPSVPLQEVAALARRSLVRA